MTSPKTIYSLESLFRICYDLKRDGRRVAITHGAFDLFHYSHLDLLKQSSRICDFLIVGVDSDENVAKYKSYKRPIVGEKARLSIVGELHCVDAALIYDQPLKPENYTQLYRELQVDIVTVGIGFGFMDVIDEQVKRADAKLIKIQTYQNPTTSSLIESIITKYSKNSTEVVPYSTE